MLKPPREVWRPTVTSASTVLLAQDTLALATLLSGAQGANIAPVIKR